MSLLKHFQWITGEVPSDCSQREGVGGRRDVSLVAVWRLFDGAGVLWGSLRTAQGPAEGERGCQ